MFSWIKSVMQACGLFVVRTISNDKISDRNFVEVLQELWWWSSYITHARTLALHIPNAAQKLLYLLHRKVEWKTPTPQLNEICRKRGYTETHARTHSLINIWCEECSANINSNSATISRPHGERDRNEQAREKNYKQNEMTTGKSAQNSVKREHSSAQFREID